ncbi:DUF1707 SHOCT-like domain-containing protein [Actinomadura rupiterrae]|uniref:DUF1707 SHOCT-like domain-containing protein n=1 Tax=Actinomadura rupiterrae TaxID=559627 RepID=UPI0020A4A27C|nr:DUF1707 domain-containing protein [Actinomadura rupiterrae]MCP2335990.1 hypothetical protein [Actinomadura rupiterrae]
MPSNTPHPENAGAPPPARNAGTPQPAQPAGARASGRDALRVGDAERDAVALALHEHFAAGRIDRGELDERLGAALAARTLADLRHVVRDLPEPNGLPAPEREPVAVPVSFGPGPFGHGRRGPHGHRGRRGPAPMWVPGRPPVWVGAGHPAFRGHHRRPVVFPVLAVLFGVVALSAGVGTALLAVFHVVMILWIVRALALLVRTRRHRRTSH